MPAACDALKRMGVKITGVLVDACSIPTGISSSGAACRACWLTCRRRGVSTVCLLLWRMPASRCASMLVVPCFCCSKIIRFSQFRPSVPGKQSTGSYPCNAPFGTATACSILAARTKLTGSLTTSFETVPTAISNTCSRCSLSPARTRSPDCLPRAPHRRRPAQRNRCRVPGKRDAAAYASTLVADARSRRRIRSRAAIDGRALEKLLATTGASTGV